MATQQSAKQPADKEARERPPLHALIIKQVIHALGQPSKLQSVQVRQVWENHYRVNVLIGEGLASAKVANSYFLVVDGAGTILETCPKILKTY